MLCCVQNLLKWTTHHQFLSVRDLFWEYSTLGCRHSLQSTVSATLRHLWPLGLNGRPWVCLLADAVSEGRSFSGCSSSKFSGSFSSNRWDLIPYLEQSRDIQIYCCLVGDADDPPVSQRSGSHALLWKDLRWKQQRHQDRKQVDFLDLVFCRGSKKAGKCLAQHNRMHAHVVHHVMLITSSPARILTTITIKNRGRPPIKRGMRGWKTDAGVPEKQVIYFVWPYCKLPNHLPHWYIIHLCCTGFLQGEFGLRYHSIWLLYYPSHQTGLHFYTDDLQ